MKKERRTQGKESLRLYCPGARTAFSYPQQTGGVILNGALRLRSGSTPRSEESLGWGSGAERFFAALRMTGKAQFLTAQSIVAVAIFALVMLSTQAQAQVNCATVVAGSLTDSDNDGFTDAQECSGIVLDLGTLPPLAFPSCVGATLGRALCLDPNSRDLFIILVSATPSLIPADPYQFISASQSAGGLGIAVHQISAAQAAADRRVTSVSLQKAIRITESLDPGGEVLGVCNYGTPNNLDGCTVFTQRIKNFVESVYASVGQTPAAGLVERYIMNTIAHESGHSLALTTDYNSRFGGYHYKSGTGVVMEQSVSYSVKGNNVTFNISTNFADPDKTGARLR